MCFFFFFFFGFFGKGRVFDVCDNRPEMIAERRSRQSATWWSERTEMGWQWGNRESCKFKRYRKTITNQIGDKKKVSSNKSHTHKNFQTPWIVIVWDFSKFDSAFIRRNGNKIKKTRTFALGWAPLFFFILFFSIKN